MRQKLGKARPSPVELQALDTLLLNGWVLMMSECHTYNQKEHLIQMIDQAFDGVFLGGGVSLHQTEVLERV